MAVDHESIKAILDGKGQNADTSLRAKALQRARSQQVPKTLTAHEWESIIYQSCLQAGDEASGNNREHHQYRERQRGLAPTGDARFGETTIGLCNREIENSPQDEPVYKDGAQEMRAQTVLTDVRIADQSALDHIPAQQTL